MAKDAQAEMITIGLKDEGGMVDEASGNEVPNGALKEEVRDDQPAMLSPGEFVIPAYAVRYIGVERLVGILREAKQGMEQLDDIGLTGEPNSDDAGLETAVLPSEMQEEGGMPTLAVGGMPTIKPGAVTTTALTNQPTQQPFGVAPPAAIQPAAAPAFAAPSPLTQQMYRPTAPIRPPAQQNVTYPEFQYSPTPGGGGYGVEEYVGPQGQAIFVTTVGGKPVSKVPEGYVTRAEYTKKQEEGITTTTPPTELQRKPEDMDPGSFESGEGEGEGAGGKDLTPSQMNALTTFGYGKGTGGAATAALGVLGGPLGLFGAVLSFFGGKAARSFARSTVSKQIARQSQNSSKPPPLDKIFTKEEAVKWNKGSMSKEDIAAAQAAQSVTDETAAVTGGKAIDAAQATAEAVANDPMSTQFDIDAAESAVVDAAEEAAGQQGISIGDYDTGSSDSNGGETGVDGGGANVPTAANVGSLASGGLIKVGDKTYGPEDFGFANKGAFVTKKKTRKPRGKGLASSM